MSFRGLWAPVLIATLCLGLGTLGGVVTARLTGAQAHVPVRFTPPSEPPLDFRLRDQNGHWTRPRDARGRVLALTFLFTSCDDVCPAEAQTIGKAVREAGRGVEVFAVSVDPVGDTPDRARRFLRRIGVRNLPFHYLLGTRRELRPVWAHFGIVPIAASRMEAEAAARSGIERLAEEQGYEEDEMHTNRTEPPAAATEAYPDTSDEQYRGRPRHDLPAFEHSAYVLLVDKHGRQRAGFPFEQLKATRLRRDMQALLAEP